MAAGDRRAALTWTVRDRELRDDALEVRGNGVVTPEWAWGGATGAGVRVCVVDSGIESGHPLVGEVRSSYVAEAEEDGAVTVRETEPSDVFGHGTACASIVRRLAPEAEIHSLRVLGGKGGGSGDVLIAGLRWAVAQGFDVLNLSLSTPRPQFGEALREIADDAFFGGTTIVASAHNSRIESFPWRFSSVVSVGSHAEDDQMLLRYNPEPPVEFFALGQSVEVAGLAGTSRRNTGNSFATPHVTGLISLILSKHPGLRPFQLKSILYLLSSNIRSLA